MGWLIVLCDWRCGWNVRGLLGLPRDQVFLESIEFLGRDKEEPRKKISGFQEIIEAFNSRYVCQLLASLRQAGKLKASVGLGQRARVEVILEVNEVTGYQKS